MKQLRSNADDLTALFEVGITARHIAEFDLLTRNVTEDTCLIRDLMEDRDFDVLPVTEAGEVCGYVQRVDLNGGPCGEYVKFFTPGDLISESTPLIQVLHILARQPRAFVLVGNSVQGIVTHGDLQKAPVRLLFFGLVTLTEMQLLRLIRLAYRDEEWREPLNDERLLAAQGEFDKRQSKNSAIDLTDCLQFCDKRDLVIREPRLRERLDFPSKSKGEKFLKAVESLRNDLAHGQDISGTSWEDTLSLVDELEAFLRKCEQILELPSVLDHHA